MASTLFMVFLIVVAGLSFYDLLTFRRKDEALIRNDLRNEPGEITQVKLTSTGSVFQRDAPRTYRVVLELPGGSRALHRYEVRGRSHLQRLL